MSGIFVRIVEVIFAFSMLVGFLPLLIIVAALIKLDSPGPILFSQRRLGKGLATFTLHKFRTMVEGASQIGSAVTASGDSRITRLGRVLRHLKLDELPQLFNILIGEMSFVGARPEVPEFVQKHFDAYTLIFSRKPGLVDPATLRFTQEADYLKCANDHEKEYLERILPQKINLSVRYVQRRSVWSDLWLLAVTVPVILFANSGWELKTWQDIKCEFSFLYRLSKRDLIKWSMDIAALLGAGLGAFVIVNPGQANIVPAVLAVWILVQGCALLLMGIPGQFWKFFSFQDVRRLCLAVGLGTLGSLPAALTFFGSLDGVRVFFVDTVLSVVFLCSLRGIRRMQYDRSRRGKGKPILVVGASDQAEPLIRQLGRDGALRLDSLAAFCPDELRGDRSFIHDTPVYSRYHALRESGVLDRIEEIHVIGDPGGCNHSMDLLMEARHRGILIRAVPQVWFSKDWRVAPVAEVNTNGLLNRKPIVTDCRRLIRGYRDKCVLVTGGAGSIGSQIVRAVAEQRPAKIVAIDLSENNLCYLDEELRTLHPEIYFQPEVGDILDAHFLEQVLQREQPDFVFHAAARKHVNFMETRVDEAVRTNVEGTLRLARAVQRAGTGVFVLISTDKAANPQNVMGATKLLAEKLLRTLASEGNTRFAVVRFGNVLGSEGSLLPILRRQIARGGPITITHRDASRFFITIREASELVLQAGTLTHGGEVFVLEMGEPVGILNLARNVAALYGKDLDELGVKYTGLKPGEKLSETLWNAGEVSAPTEVPGIYAATHSQEITVPDLSRLEELCLAATLGNKERSLQGLLDLVPEYMPSMEACQVLGTRNGDLGEEDERMHPVDSVGSQAGHAGGYDS